MGLNLDIEEPFKQTIKSQFIAYFLMFQKSIIEYYHLVGCEYHCLTRQVIFFEISPFKGDIFQQLPELILYDVIVIVVTVDDVMNSLLMIS